MSWSVSVIGKPANVCAELGKQSEALNGQSKIEFDAALPHLLALVKENFGSIEPTIHLRASGHGSAQEGKQVQRTCSVSIEPTWTKLV
jgi:hypothetical protein